MNKFANNTSRFLALICLSTGFLFGSTAEETPAEFPSVSTEERIAQERFAEADESEEVQIQERTVRDPFYPIDYSSFAITTIGHKGGTVNLSDGSLWTIRSSDCWVVSGWNDNYNKNSPYTVGPSKVYITSNNSWLSSATYPYMMVNKDTGESVYCNISQTAPLENTIWVQFIDYNSGKVELAHANGYNTFYLSAFDDGIYTKWQAGDRVFYGRNSRWNSVSSPYLLINLRTLTNARASL